MRGLRATPRLSAVLTGFAVVCLVLGRWSLGSLALGLAAVMVVVLVFDVRRLVSMEPPRVTGPERLRASLRRNTSIEVRFGPGATPRIISVRIPWQLGGPVPAFSRARAGSTIVFRCTPRRRGRHALGPLWFWLESPLRLFRRRFVTTLTTSVEVTPDLHGPMDDPIGRELHDEGYGRAIGVVQTGNELRGLRTFTAGDDPRHVDWKASARAGIPIVREWEPDRRRRIVLVVDAGRLMRAEHDGETKLDAALRAVTRLAMAAEARDDEVGVLVYADRVLRFVPPLGGECSARRLLELLIDVEPKSVESLPEVAVPHLLRIGRRSLVVFLTDILDTGAADALVGAVSQLRRQHLPIVALLRDPELERALARPVTEETVAYERAAAELVVRDREHAVAALSARGVGVVDTSMAEVAARVVQSYLDARFRARW
jgi:uncharacterized protein (DUF58 family)